MDATVVVSACPQDQNLTCGGRPTDIRVEIGLTCPRRPVRFEF